jgi:membrane-bound lytic murein transglycosylase D
MSELSFALVRLYLGCAIALTVGACLIQLGAYAWEKRKTLLPARSVLKASYLLLLLSTVTPLLVHLLPQEQLLRPSVQVFSGASKKDRADESFTAALQPSLYPAVRSRLSFSKPHLQTAGLLLALLTIGTLVSVVLQWIALSHWLGARVMLKRIGNVQLLVSDDISVPCAAWGFFRRSIVMPSSYFEKPLYARMSIRHEAEHLRNADPLAVFFLVGLQRLFFWNPFIGRLAGAIHRLQEFACDAHVVGHHSVSPQAYGRCLLFAAETAANHPGLLVGTTSMARAMGGEELKRRIEMILENRERMKKAVPLPVVILAGLLICGSAFVAHSAVQQKKLTMEEATRYAKLASEKSAVPIDMNEKVLSRLNELIATESGRKFSADAFARLPKYQEMIRRIFSQYEVPEELIGLALFESGLNNDLVSSMKATGIWQFVPNTARRYQLVVDGITDERRIPEKETVAAARYLKDLFAQFKDWRLAIKAYNEGENRVAKLIKTHGTADAWAIDKASNTENYLSGAIAAMILYRNPDLLK